MGKKPKILVVGSLVMDLTVSTRRFPEPGETVLGSSFQSAPGGKGANQTIQAARLGADVTMVGMVGGDAFGQTLLQSLKAAGVDASHVEIAPESSSAVGAILLHPDGHGGIQNRIIVVPGANACVTEKTLAFLEREISRYDFMMLQLEIPLEANRRAVELARAAGVPVMLNPAPAAPLPEDLLDGLTYLSPNEHEAAVIAGTEPVRTQVLPAARMTAEALARRGVENVLVTLGGNGAALLRQGQFFHSPCVPVEKVLDPTAAGDSFIAAFSVAVCQGLDAAAALEFANCTAALTVSRMGAQPSLPSLNQVLLLLEQTGRSELKREVEEKW